MSGTGLTYCAISTCAMPGTDQAYDAIRIVDDAGFYAKMAKILWTSNRRKLALPTPAEAEGGGGGGGGAKQKKKAVTELQIGRVSVDMELLCGVMCGTEICDSKWCAIGYAAMRLLQVGYYVSRTAMQDPDDRYIPHAPIRLPHAPIYAIAYGAMRCAVLR
eukprot:248253-Rhodomonas_salina.3